MASNPIDLIQVLDDFVKIASGALVAGAFTWMIAKHTSKSAIDKLKFERRSKILSDVAQSYESYFQVFLKLSTTRSVMQKEHGGPTDEERDEVAVLEECFNKHMHESFSSLPIAATW
jgi:hypothetical protein